VQGDVREVKGVGSLFSGRHTDGSVYLSEISKPILDEIDRVLAAHYGFTDEELDFIINYDIKYRMGREAESEEE
jgi:hypothetical protein